MDDMLSFAYRSRISEWLLRMVRHPWHPDKHLEVKVSILVNTVSRGFNMKRLTDSSIFSALPFTLLLRSKTVSIATFSAIIILFAQRAFLVEHVYDIRIVSGAVFVRFVANIFSRLCWAFWLLFSFLFWRRSRCCPTLSFAVLFRVEVVCIALASTERECVTPLAALIVVPASLIFFTPSVEWSQCTSILNTSASTFAFVVSFKVVLISTTTGVRKVHADSRTAVIMVPAFVLLTASVTGVHVKEAIPTVKFFSLSGLLRLGRFWCLFFTLDATVDTSLFIDKVVSVSAAPTVVELSAARFFRIKVPVGSIVLTFSNFRRQEADVLLWKGCMGREKKEVQTLGSPHKPFAELVVNSGGIIQNTVND